MDRVINMYDWFQAFRAVWIHDEDDEDADDMDADMGGAKAKEAKEKELHARFIQVTSELQMLGFIKPCGRKADHVTKVTFSFG